MAVATAPTRRRTSMSKMFVACIGTMYLVYGKSSGVGFRFDRGIRMAFVFVARRWQVGPERVNRRLLATLEKVVANGQVEGGEASVSVSPAAGWKLHIQQLSSLGGGDRGRPVA